MLELKKNDRREGFLKEGEKYKRRMPQDFGTMMFGAVEVLKNIFDLVPALDEGRNVDGIEKCFYCLE